MGRWYVYFLKGEYIINIKQVVPGTEPHYLLYGLRPLWFRSELTEPLKHFDYINVFPDQSMSKSILENRCILNQGIHMKEVSYKRLWKMQWCEYNPL